MDDWNPYAAPPDPDPADNLPADQVDPNRPAGLWRKGKLLVLRRDAVVPDWCVRTGESAGGRRRMLRLRWTPRWLQLGSSILALAITAVLVFDLLYSSLSGWPVAVAVLLLIPAAITEGILTKRAEVEFGLSAAARSRENVLATFNLLSVILLVAVFFVVQVSYGRLPAEFFVGMFVYIIVARVVRFLRHPITAAHIDDEYVHLRNVHPDYLARLPEWPNE